MTRITSSELAKMKSEIQALKVTQPLNGGALTRHSVEESWSGTIDKNDPISQYSMLAAFEVTFSRSDGVNKTPLVQFAYKLDPDMTNYSHSRSYGAIIAAAQDYVVYKIVLDYNWWPFSESQTTGSVELTVNAYSPVDGTLEIERVYS